MISTKTRSVPRRALFALLLSVGTLPMCGCSKDTPLSSAARVLPVTTSAKAVTPSSTGSAPSNEKAADSPNEATGAEEVAKFDPPFPQRSNPFQRPVVAKSAHRETSGGGAVALKGFVTVDGVRAILEIDGELGSFQEGDLYRDVQIVQVSPPNVILQRGRTRWTATLFEGL